MRHDLLWLAAIPTALWLGARPVAAQQSLPDAGELPVIVITADRDKAVALPPAESTTVIDAKVIERKQSSTLFDVVKDVPGVAVDGGPRSTGMKFNIRGFRGNDDVLFKIDGGVKGFDKYRFGSGVFIEPELIRSVVVERGPSILTGAGAVGGSIVATTKSAADFLRGDERAGGLVKLGFNDNNNERLQMLTAFARPTDRTDLLVSWVRRDSDDFRLGGGERFPASSNDIEGTLVKLGMALHEDVFVELSRTGYTSGPTYTPFDTNSSTAQVGGYVHQSVDDATVNLRFTYEPANPWIKLRGTLADESTDLDNLMRPGESSFAVACSADPCEWNALGPATGDMHDRWRYAIRTAELFNDSRWAAGPVRGLLTVGVQALRNERDLRRLTENPLMNGPDGKYPGGFDAQQPPGIKRSLGYVAQNAFEWSDITFMPGVRWDRYELEATGQAALDRQALGEATTYRFERTSPSLTLSWRPGAGDWWLTHRWVKSFRPPLITDYFSLGAASPCAGLVDGGQAIAPNGCGDAIVPATSLNREWTLAWAPARWASGATTQARMTYYEIDTEHLNGANYLAVQDGELLQPWSETRHGAEFELSHEARTWYLSFNYAQISARRRNALDGSAFSFTSGIPGDTAGASAGYRLFDEKLELGYRIRQIYDQLVLPGATSLTETTQYCGEVTSDGVVHAANTQQDVYAMWRPTRRLTVQGGVNNVFDKHWCNNGDELGNIIGLQGPGRSVKLSMTLQF